VVNLNPQALNIKQKAISVKKWEQELFIDNNMYGVLSNLKFLIVKFPLIRKTY
jgi:hypothetical protein